MRNYARLLDVLDHAESGEIMLEKDFDRLISKTIRELTKKYDIVYNRADAIVMDDAFADRLFEAGLEAAVRIGVYCTDTNKRMTFTREELTEALRWAPDSLLLGSGNDKAYMPKRRPEDSTVPLQVGGPFGAPLPEELYSVIMESYIKEPVIDSVTGGTFLTIHGRRPRTRTAWEVLMAWREIEFMRAAAQRASRPGISIGVVQNAVSEIGELAGTTYNGFHQGDWHNTCFVSELKTNQSMFIKVSHLIKTGCIIHSFYNPIFGGHAGGADGLAVIGVAGIILMNMVNMSTTFGFGPAHPFYNCSSAPDTIWAISAVQQAVTRNTHLLTTIMTSPVSGPLTESLLYECAATATAATVSGTSRVDGVRSAVGVELAHCTGLEARFNAEVSRAACGLSRKDANRMILEFQKGYMPVLDKKPIGKSFTEVYDPISVRPTQEWLDMYGKVKDEVAALGLRLAR